MYVSEHSLTFYRRWTEGKKMEEAKIRIIIGIIIAVCFGVYTNCAKCISKQWKRNRLLSSIIEWTETEICITCCCCVCSSTSFRFDSFVHFTWGDNWN